MNAPQLRIDSEFQALIAPLQLEEREQLEANLVAEGCRDPLVTWRGILIDGHNRYEICERRGIKYRTVEIALSSREHVLLWIEENQLGRRNLSDDQRGVIGRSIEIRRIALGPSMSERGKLGGRGKKKLPATSTGSFHDRSKESRRRAAKEAKVSEHKIRQVREIEQKMPEALPAVRAGEKTLLDVKREIREQEREQQREANRALAANTMPLPVESGEFMTIVIDPPWDWGDEGDADQFGRGAAHLQHDEHRGDRRSAGRRDRREECPLIPLDHQPLVAQGLPVTRTVGLPLCDLADVVQAVDWHG